MFAKKFQLIVSEYSEIINETINVQFLDTKIRTSNKEYSYTESELEAFIQNNLSFLNKLSFYTDFDIPELFTLIE